MAPGEFLGGRTLDYKKHCKAGFGSYVQTHEENFPRNSMQSRTLGAITLGPDISARGVYYFMNLNTGKKIHRRNWTPVPMPNEVITRVEQLRRKDGQPKLMVNTDKVGDNFID